MKKIFIILLFLTQTALFSAYNIVENEKLGCDCETFVSVSVDETTNTILITCDSGKIVKTNLNFSDCELFQIEGENESADVVVAGDYYYFSSRNITQPTVGRLHSSSDLKSFETYHFSNTVPTNLFEFNDSVYSISIGNGGALFYKFDSLNFEYVNQIPLNFFDVCQFQGYAVGVGFSPGIGVYIHKSIDLMKWEQIFLSDVYPLLRSPKTFSDYLYITGENGEIIILDKVFTELKTYNLGENIRITDIMLDDNTGDLYVLSRNKGNNISQVLFIDLETEKVELIKEFDVNIVAREFFNIGNTYHFITSEGKLYNLEAKTDVSHNNSKKFLKKQIINKAGLISLSNGKNNLKLYNIDGKEITFNNLMSENYLIGINEESIVIIKSF